MIAQLDCHLLRRHRLDIIQPARSPPLILSVILLFTLLFPISTKGLASAHLPFRFQPQGIQHPTTHKPSSPTSSPATPHFFTNNFNDILPSGGSCCSRVVASSSTHKTNLFCRHGRLTETSLPREKLQTKCPVPQSLVVRYAVEVGTVAGKNTFTSRCSSGVSLSDGIIC